MPAPIKMGTVWDRTAEFLSDNIGAIVPVAVIAFFVPVSIRSNILPLMEHAPTQLALIVALTSLALAVVSLWGVLTLTALALDPAQANGAGMLARRRLGTALLVWGSLFVVMTAAAVLPVTGLLAATGYDLQAIARGEPVVLAEGIELAVTLYMVGWCVAYLWLSARLIVATPLIVHERRGFDALARSFALTRGATLQVVGVLLLFALVAIVAVLAAQFGFGSIFELIDGPGGDAISLASVLTSVMVAAVATAFLVVMSVFPAKLLLALSSERGRAPSA